MVFSIATDTALVDQSITESSHNDFDILRQDLMLSDNSSSTDVYEPSDLDKLTSSDSEDEHPVRKKRKLARWPTSEPDKWKKNVANLKGYQETHTLQRKVRNELNHQSLYCLSCRWGCATKFNDNLRKQICSEFWKLDYCRQKDFILKYVVNEPSKTRRVRLGTGPRKNYSRVYFLQKEEEKVRVCKSFF